MNLYSLRVVLKMIRNQKSLIFYEWFRYKPLPVVQLLENFAICDKEKIKYIVVVRKQSNLLKKLTKTLISFSFKQVGG